MIKVKNEFFILDTDSTSYVFMKIETGHLVHVYYGAKLTITDEVLESFKVNYKSNIGNAVCYDQDHLDLFFETIHFEVPTLGKGDVRDPMIEIINTNGSHTQDFKFSSYEIGKPISYNSIPSSKYTDDIETLFVQLKDDENNIELKLAYNVFNKENIITRQAWIKNLNNDEIKILKAYSYNLDMKNVNLNLKSFHGHWINEMNEYNQKLVIGTYSNEVITGSSSNRVNPFFMVYKDGASENAGESYGFNIIYSGNHKEVLECDSLGNIRIKSGINPNTFNYGLNKNEVFEVPEGVMSYSNKGFNSLSHNFHEYIKEHIVDENFKAFPRRVLNNSWEACYFNFNESKLLKMARCAKKLGVELFVLDDGWFKGRNNDTSSLGDWIEDKKKLRNGLRGLSDKIRKVGLEFGIWVEPEMVNKNSDLFRNHKDWAIMIDGHNHSEGRNQIVLDLSNKEVVDYLFNSLCYVLDEARPTYVKWDMNRVWSDYYSNNLDKEHMMELNHRYYIGLYDLFKRLKAKYPNVLIEGCASGGNRFDLGILSYCPQIWASDDTDAMVRANMQYNYSYGYPISTLGCHTASSPTTSTLRRVDLETRFNNAFMGAFGYEIDLREESKEGKKLIKKQIEFYKSIRDKLVDNDYYRILNKDGRVQFESITKDKSVAFITDTQCLNKPANPYTSINVKGFDEASNYIVHADKKDVNIKKLGGTINMVSPIKIRDGGLIQALLSKVYKLKDYELSYKTNGTILNNKGLDVNQSFDGSGLTNDMRIFLDFDSRLYVVRKED